MNLVAEGRANKTSEAKARAGKAQMLTWWQKEERTRPVKQRLRHARPKGGGAKERTGAMDDPGALLAKARKARGGGPRSEEMCSGD